ncbi:hypothetical protein FOS14_19445 [Skermania sp. ID1734]|uniref:MinD/ParA family ATP-binding protein n=1 Tax=Skermania sp. ID1734 TaxID=2597516 RepID=UPI00117DFB50|nr:hypothetical protein [Skermania sp. ID1734]TSD94819.1 hypothetical protein FOS14_19445 [Skermania sp. ID1734]
MTWTPDPRWFDPASATADVPFEEAPTKHLDEVKPDFDTLVEAVGGQAIDNIGFVRGNIDPFAGFAAPTKHLDSDGYSADARVAVAAESWSGGRSGTGRGLILVACGKGRTPLSLGLGTVLSAHRGDGRVVVADLSEIGGALSARAENAPRTSQDAAVLATTVDLVHFDVSAVERHLTRQSAGVDILGGRPSGVDEIPLDASDMAVVVTALRRVRDVVVADSDAVPNDAVWGPLAAAADVLLIPVPLLTTDDVTARTVEQLQAIAAVSPQLIPRTCVLVTDVPGHDGLEVEYDFVEAVLAVEADGASPRVCRMPYDPWFASSDRLDPFALDATTVRALTALSERIGVLYPTT